MTNIPEANLAREAEICYTTIAMVTDYDCWHPEHDNVTVEQIIKTFSGNAVKAQQLLAAAIPIILKDKTGTSCPCHHALDSALITAPEKRDSDFVKKLDAVAGRVLKG